jgi:hypothetical protein
MRFPVSILLAASAVSAACTNGQQPGGGSSAGGSSAPAAARPGAAPAPSASNPDPDRAVSGTGVPAGYIGRTDDASSNISDAKYTSVGGGMWEVQTGPAHILYSLKDTASGSYTLRTQIDQAEAPHHPEAYGVFFGGQNLADASERYTYFIVRGNGMYAIKARDGASARTVVDFTANPNVPKADASGKASYVIGVQVGADSVRFLVNEKPVASLPKGSLTVAGIAGIRINHNLHVLVKPLVIGR